MHKSSKSIFLIFLILIGNIFQIVTAYGENNIEQAQNLPKPPSSHLLPFRQVLKPNDEGSHQSKSSFILTQEWWYFNVYFNKPDSELRNWSLMVSFNEMGNYDVFFLTLYDDTNKSYGGSKVLFSNAIQSSGPGVNVQYNNSYAVGSYPIWHIYAKDGKLNENNITVNITYTANSLPLWLAFNTGHNLRLSPGGHYCIKNCEVTGQITINEISYTVHGVGYHEHSWFKFLSKQPKEMDKIDMNIEQTSLQETIDSWDWFCCALDNGWDMFSGKFLQQSIFAKVMPGNLWVTPDGENITECTFFSYKFLETVESSVPSIKIPTKIRIRGIFLNTLITNPLKGLVRLDVIIRTKNIHEFLWGDPPVYGMWEGPCSINGTIKWKDNTVELNGWAIMELTRKVL